MSDVFARYVLLHRAEIQPSDDHITFVSGNMDADLNVEVPNECLYVPLATWMALDTPDILTIRLVAGNQMPNKEG